MSEPSPRPRLTIKPWHVVAALAAALGIIAIVGAFLGNFDSEPEQTPSDRLCSLVRTGWTGNELIASDVWRDWDSSQSSAERTRIVLHNADVGGCADAL